MTIYEMGLLLEKDLKVLIDRIDMQECEKMDLQNRINKAIEYIRINKCNNNDINDCWHEDFKNILDILKGEK